MERTIVSTPVMIGRLKCMPLSADAHSKTARKHGSSRYSTGLEMSAALVKVFERRVPAPLYFNPPEHDSIADPVKYQNWIYHKGVEPHVLSQSPLSISHAIAEIPHLRRVPSAGHK